MAYDSSPLSDERDQGASVRRARATSVFNEEKRLIRAKVIIPARNEEESIGDIIQRLQRMGFDDILVVDGHSHDGTAECARKLGARVVSQNGKGKGGALREAFLQCLDDDLTVIMDADGSMDPEELPLFFDKIVSGADIVKGSRFLPPGDSEDFTATRRIGNKILTTITNFLFLTEYTDLCYGYMAFNKEALKRLSPSLKGDNFEIETEICVKAKILGLRVLEVPSFERSRQYGGSNLHPFKDGLSILRMIVTEFLKENSFGAA
jgi:glycosyltransferase involved in cell wall biosynthesis